MQKISPKLLTHFFAFLIAIFQADAQSWNQVVKVTANDRAELNNFGYSVDIFGDYAIAGSPGDDKDVNGNNTLTNAGSAYVLYKDAGTWRQIKKLCATNRQENVGFGSSVSINGEYVVVGSHNENLDETEANVLRYAGSAYIFGKDRGGMGQWGLVKKITASTRRDWAYFGFSVSISGDYLIVGAYQDSDFSPGSNQFDYSGSAYIFKKDQGGSANWGFLQKLTASDRTWGDSFGNSVYIRGNNIIVGAYQAHDPTFLNPVGAAYIFIKQEGTDNWQQIKKLSSPVKTEFDYFGRSVAIDGEYAIVGAMRDSEDASESNYMRYSGSAYIFKQNSGGSNNWNMIKKITASDRAGGDEFGTSVGISGDFAVVGANYEDENNPGVEPILEAGSAFIFSKNENGADGWGQVQQLTSPKRSLNDRFGSAVAMRGGRIIVGTIAEDEDAQENNSMTDPGAAYIFTSSTVLPVTLTSFNVTKKEKQILLNWATSSETNSSKYEIQRSADGHIWRTIGSVGAAERSDEHREYSFDDQKPLAGISLYRLKMIDRDNTFAYSRIENVSFDNQQNFAVYPNPVSGKFFFEKDELESVRSIKIMNALGVEVAQYSQIPSTGMVVSHLDAGLYIIQIDKIDGSRIIRKLMLTQ